MYNEKKKKNLPSIWDINDAIDCFILMVFSRFAPYLKRIPWGVHRGVCLMTEATVWRVKAQAEEDFLRPTRDESLDEQGELPIHGFRIFASEEQLNQKSN
jgi:hypothetical protein